MSINETNISWPLEFVTTNVCENSLLSNHYSLVLAIEPISNEKTDLGKGFEKLKYFVEYQLSNSILINKDSELAAVLATTNNNIVEFPCEPYDFYVGSVLLAKMSKIVENYFDIGLLTIDSVVGDRVQYTIWDPYSSGLDLSNESDWWNQDNASTNNQTPITWKDLNLSEGAKFDPKVIKGGRLNGKK